MNPLKLVNKKAAMQAVKVGALATAGIVAAKAGGSLMRRIDAVETFAAKSPTNAAIVDTVGGIAVCALVFGGLAAAGKSKVAAATAPFLLGGVVVAALGPVIVDKASGAIDGAISRFMPGGAPRRALRLMQPVSAMPGGLLAGRIGGVALGGTVPGGLTARRTNGIARSGSPF